MDKREFKNKVYGELAKTTKALANPHRMEIIDLLAQGSFPVETIAQYTGMSIANASQHLQVLKSARLVDTTRRGNFIHYHLANEKVFQTWRSLRELGIAHNAEVEKLMNDYRKGYHPLEPIAADELLKKIETGKVVLLDVRPEEEYARGHIHRALSMPIDQISKRIKELSKDKEIIAYCRGPLCVYADEAVELLTKTGFSANRMVEGFPDWQAKGYPIE
ncbi:metalloregulator ArsR/SmtB family transcription factor [Parapedobacter tibetensis]|uniref:metalloregulator ArsR/SmtB family transcription factor n=1 Tax=Parapedobacter tibetensis TaxID=2972951 RepID=UPI00214D9379|nr:metalloregulator ArsR/SmtB family transcription factor [Parapedobacter tibetensis]